MRKETRGCSSTCSGPDLVVALSVPAEIYAWERGAQRFFGQRSEVSLGAPPIVRAAHLSNSELVAQCSPSEPDRSFQLLFCFLSGWSFLLPAALVLMMLCILAAVKVNEIGNIQLGCNTSVLQLRSDEQKSWDPHIPRWPLPEAAAASQIQPGGIQPGSRTHADGLLVATRPGEPHLRR